jgi:hypothetical protein
MLTVCFVSGKEKGNYREAFRHQQSAAAKCVWQGFRLKLNLVRNDIHRRDAEDTRRKRRGLNALQLSGAPSAASLRLCGESDFVFTQLQTDP